MLLDLYGERYERGKRARSGLDFEDLELIARDLLERHEGLREQYAERFSHVLVDEFQDTNPLQNELIEQLERDNLFRVGDEHQSIYGFRHADVEVFRGHWERAAAEGRAESITRELPQPRRGARGHRRLLRSHLERATSSRCARPRTPAPSPRA